MFAAHGISRLEGHPTDGIHLMWWPPDRAGYSLDGFDIWRRDSTAKIKSHCFGLTTTQLARLHRDFRVQLEEADFWLEAGGPISFEAPVFTHMTAHDYRVVGVSLDSPTSRVEVSTNARFVAALRNGEVVDGKFAVGGSPFVLDGPEIDSLRLWYDGKVTSLRICVATASADWANACLLVRELQLPFQAVHPDVGSVDEELAMVQRRANGVETGDFRRLSHMMNEALEQAARVSALRVCQAQRAPDIRGWLELHPWGVLSMLTLEPPWRVALGYGWHDDKDLVPGRLYDYRIVGRFRRRDVDEHVVDLSTVPADMPVPLEFGLGDVTVFLYETATIERVVDRKSELQTTHRKAVKFDGRMRLRWPEPTDRIVLLFAGNDDGLRIVARDADGDVVDTVTAPPGDRIDVSFAAPARDFAIEGRAYFVGIVRKPLAPEADLDEIVERDVTVERIVYQATNPPASPRELDVTNLQQPQEPLDKEPAHELGFHIQFQPPLRADRTDPWPPGLARPTDVQRYVLERRDVSDAGEWEPYDASTSKLGKGHVVGASPDLTPRPTATPGADLLALYPATASGLRPTGPVTVEDVLRSERRPKGPEPNTKHQYRVWSIDALGRTSTTAATSSEVRLEKHRRPPIPHGPDRDSEPADSPAEPRGVMATVVRLDDGTPHIEVEWDYADKLLGIDPFVETFRIYWRALPPVHIDGVVTIAASHPDGWRIRASLGRPVEADEFVGQFITIGKDVYRVLQHDAGEQPYMVVARPRVESDARPQPDELVLLARTGEAVGGRPTAWDRRLAEVDVSVRSHTITDTSEFLHITAKGPRLRGYIGVSAADAQCYVPDEFYPAGHPLARKGNESNVAPAPVRADYDGRPDFSPPSLPAAPVVRLNTGGGADVQYLLDLPALLPNPCGADERIRLSRALATDLERRLDVDGGDLVVRIDPVDGVEQPPLSFESDPAQPAIELIHQAVDAGERVAPELLIELARLTHGVTESSWVTVPSARDFGVLPITFPNKPDTWFLRLEVVGPDDRASEAALYLPRAYQVPAPFPPATPRLGRPRPTPTGAGVVVELTQPAHVAGIHVFTTHSLDKQARHNGRLVQLPNRPDLYPSSGVRMRIEDEWTPSSFVPVEDGVYEDNVLRFVVDTNAPPDSLMSIWCATISPEGICSPLVGPVRFIVPTTVEV